MSLRHAASTAFALVLAAGVMTPTSARADKPSALGAGSEAPDPREVAKERYRAGVAEFQAGHFKDAVDLFLEADQLAPSAALSYNIARAYGELGDRAASLGWYRDYLRRAPDADDADDVRKIVDGLEATLEKQGVQQVTILSEPHGATVVIDQRPVGVTPWTGQLPPGQHTASLRLRGYADASRGFTLPPDDAIDVSFRLVPGKAAPAEPEAPAAESKPAAAPAGQPAAAPAEPESPVLGIVGWSVLGVGVASLGTGIVFEVLRGQAETDAEEAPHQIAFVDAVDTMESRQTLSRIFVGVGGGLMLVGGALVAIDAGVFSSGGDEAAWSVGCTDEGCAATARGRF